MSEVRSQAGVLELKGGNLTVDAERGVVESETVSDEELRRILEEMDALVSVLQEDL